MKRVLVMTGNFYPDVGGAITDIFEISRRLIKRGYEVDITTCNTKGALPYEQFEGINIYRLDSWNMLEGRYPVPKPSPRNLRVLWNLLRKRHDLVHVYTRFYVNSTLGLVFSRLKRVPLLYTELGAGHTVSPSKLVSIINRIYDHTLGILLVKLADKITVESQSTVPFLQHLGLSKEAILIPCGVNMLTFQHKSNNLREKLGIQNAIVITSISRLAYGKGIQDLLLAFPGIKQELGATKILVVGGGDYEQELRALATQVDRENIYFLGEKKQQEVVEILSIADIAVSTSYAEALSSSVLEAMAMGLPVIVSNVGGAPEIITDGETGMLFEPGDTNALTEKVCQVARSKDLANKLGNNAQQLIKEEFNWDNIVELYGETIEHLCRG